MGAKSDNFGACPVHDELSSYYRYDRTETRGERKPGLHAKAKKGGIVSLSNRTHDIRERDLLWIFNR